MCVLSLILAGGSTLESAPCVYSTCVKHLFYGLLKRRRGVSLKVAFFLFRQQWTVQMRPFTEYSLTSSVDACVVLNISVCAKKPWKQGDKQTEGGGDHQWSEYRQLQERAAPAAALTTPEGGKALVQDQHHWTSVVQEKKQRRLSLHMWLQVPLSFPASTAAHRRN